MNKVDFFGRQVTKLIIGDNPMNGHSYIEDKITGAEMLEYYTAERFKETLFRMEECGCNTMMPLADPYVIRLLQEYRREGGKLQFIFQTFPAMDQKVSIHQMMSVDPIGVYYRGADTDNLFEAGKFDELMTEVEQYRVMGIPVGLGTHRPDVIDTSEREGWKVDFYMGCLQNARLTRTDRKNSYIPGETKSSLIFYPEDRAVMLESLRKAAKPALAFKIFAGGQMFLGKSEEEKRQAIKAVYDEVFTALKPNDMAVIGVFQRDLDQIGENIALYNEWYDTHRG